MILSTEPSKTESMALVSYKATKMKNIQFLNPHVTSTFYLNLYSPFRTVIVFIDCYRCLVGMLAFYVFTNLDFQPSFQKMALTEQNFHFLLRRIIALALSCI